MTSYPSPASLRSTSRLTPRAALLARPHLPATLRAHKSHVVQAAATPDKLCTAGPSASFPCACASATPQVPTPPSPEVAATTTKPAFSWRERWWPLALVEDLSTQEPTGMRLLGDRLVIWRDADKQWQVFDDICPHRQAPLSDGRINERGDLECCYHGWSFEGSGACTDIPLAVNPKERQAMAHPKAGAKRYPVTVSDGLLWVWPNTNGHAAAKVAPPPALPARHVNPDYRTLTIARDLELPYAQVIENVCDPSHVPFAHHGILGDRHKPDPQSFRPLRKQGEGFVAESDSVELTFHAPYAVFDRLDIGGGKTMWFNFIAIPLEPGRTRLITVITRNFYNFADLPRWISHIQQNAVLDGDAFIIQQQALTLDPNKPYAKQTFCPTHADRAALEFRRWLEKTAGSIPWAPGTDTTYRPVGPRQLLEREHQHADICESCHGALRGVDHAQKLLAVAQPSLIAASVAVSGQHPQLGAALAGLAVMGAAIATLGLPPLRKRLTGLDRYERK